MNLNLRRVKTSDSASLKNFSGEHVAMYVTEHNSLLLLSESLKKNQAFMFSIDKLAWSVHTTNGRKPTSRSFYASYYDDKEQAIFIHGGSSEPGRSLDDFHVLYVKTWTWKKLFCEIPHAREGHSMVGFKGGMIVHGGVSYPENQFLNDTWVVKGKVKYTQQPQLHGLVFEKIHTKGLQPPARKYHKAFVNNDQLFVIGGETKENEGRFSIYCLNLISKTWKQVKTPSNIRHRSSFSLVTNKDSQAIIFGGENAKNKTIFNQMLLFNPDKQSIQTISLKQQISARSNHSMVVIGDDPFKAWIIGVGNKNQPIQLYQLFENSFSTEQQYEDYVFQLQKQLQSERKQQIKLQNQITKLQTSSKQPDQSQTLIENILMLIKSQQYLSQQLQKKDESLQSLLKSMQSYIHVLYQNYKNYEQNPSIQQTKQHHIYICLKLKDTYKSIERLNKKNMDKIYQHRSNIASINRQLQGFMETEVDQDY